MRISLLFISALVATAFTECPDGYSLCHRCNTCVYPVYYKKNFLDARKFCKSYGGGDLIQIRELIKAKEVMHIIGNPDYHWIGVWEQRGKFTYIDGSPLGNYQPWLFEAPKHEVGGVDACIVVAGAGLIPVWNNISCHLKMPFICEAENK